MNREAILMQLYAAFNARDADGALRHLEEDVVWPNGMHGGFVHGKASVESYWRDQWSTIESHVEPLAIQLDGSRAIVEVNQTVRSLKGELIQNGIVVHTYTFRGAKIARMDIATREDR